jgi:Uma2 family endonuclease
MRHRCGEDREIKMPIYARYGVAYAWLLDPRPKTIEAYHLGPGEWLAAGQFSGDTAACIPPFDAVSIDLAVLWDDGSDA